jgi:hypothetical protein
MARGRRWDLQAVVEMGLLPVPEDAPVRFKGRYAGLVEAFAKGHCPECLVDLVVVTECGQPWSVKMEHYHSCPFSPESMSSLARELGFSGKLSSGPPAVEMDHELFKAIESLEIDPYL